MEIYERIRVLRKDFLKLSQESFGERLGVSRSVIKNIELDALARPEQKLSLLKLICKEFSVSEEWLLNGVGDMFDSKNAEYNTLIDHVLTGENEFAKSIFKAFALFEESDWESLQHMIEIYLSVAENPAADLDDDVPDTPEELEERFPVIDLDVQSNAG